MAQVYSIAVLTIVQGHAVHCKEVQHRSQDEVVTEVIMQVARYLHLRAMNGRGRWWRFAVVCVLCISFAVILALLIENH